METNAIAVWVCDEWTKRVVDMTKEELIEALQALAKQVDDLKEDRDRWMKAADPVAYMFREGSE